MQTHNRKTGFHFTSPILQHVKLDLASVFWREKYQNGKLTIFFFQIVIQINFQTKMNEVFINKTSSHPLDLAVYYKTHQIEFNT